MTKPDAPQLDALEALLAEKRKHEGYLAKLEERRAGTPEHVFARLRDEYLTKLMDAQVRAHAEAEALESGLEVDQAAVAEIEARLTALGEERVEGELREAVGELDPKDWQVRLEGLNSDIAKAEEERDALTSAAARVRALVAEARGEPVVPAKVEPVADAAAAKPAPRADATAPLANAPSFDELAFLQSVVGRQSTPALPIAPVEPIAPPPASPPVASKPEVTREPELALDSPMLGVAEGQPTADLSAPNPLATGLAAPNVAAPEMIDPEDAEPPSVLGRAGRSTQSIKTLKCADCGALNYPTEWYCERCGGELAAL